MSIFAQSTGIRGSALIRSQTFAVYFSLKPRALCLNAHSTDRSMVHNDGVPTTAVRNATGLLLA
jgi:hypothetical protein